MSRKNEDFDEYCDPENPRTIKHDDIVDAAVRMKPYIIKTPCVPSLYPSLYTMNLYYKLETMQKSGSFKERGGLNALQLLPMDKKKIGIVIASIGNEALGLCVHAKQLSVPVLVVMPFHVSISKIQRLYNLGAKVVIQGSNLMDCQKHARALAREKGLTYFNGRDHPHILAGYGTVALEILEQVPTVDAIILPVGSGGLAAAISKAIKQLKPACLVYGVQPEVNSGFFKALEKEDADIVSTLAPSLAESIAVPNVGCNALASALPLLDKMLLVKEDWIARAVLHLMEKERYVTEGAGACPLAAIIGDLVPELKLKTVVCILSGGNVDTILYTRCLDRGLAAESRLVKFCVYINDSTSGKCRVFDLLANAGYNLVYEFQNREWMDNDYYSLQLKLVVQTKNLEHALQLKRLVERAYPTAEFDTEPFNDKRTCPCYVRKIM